MINNKDVTSNSSNVFLLCFKLINPINKTGGENYVINNYSFQPARPNHWLLAG